MVSKRNERGTLHTSAAKEKSTPGSDTEVTATVWTWTCRMNDGQKMKLLEFGIMDKNNKIGRSHDVIDGAELAQELRAAVHKTEP